MFLMVDTLMFLYDFIPSGCTVFIYTTDFGDLTWQEIGPM